MRRLAILLGVLGALFAHARARGRNPARLSGNAPDGARHLQPAVQDSRAWRRLAARDLPQAARGHDRRDAAAGAVRRRRLHRAPHGPAQRRARGAGHRNRWPVGHLHRHAGADRKPRRRHADRAALADEDDVRRPGRAGFLGSCQDISVAWGRTHPVRVRSSAVRSGPGDPGPGLAARCPHRDGVHRRAQHHARGGNAWVRQRAGPAGRSRHRAQHRAGRRRDRECAARDARR